MLVRRIRLLALSVALCIGAGCTVWRTVEDDLPLARSAHVRVGYAPARDLPVLIDQRQLVSVEWVEGRVLLDGLDTLWLAPRALKSRKRSYAPTALADTLALPRFGAAISTRHVDGLDTTVSLMVLASAILAVMVADGLRDTH